MHGEEDNQKLGIRKIKKKYQNEIIFPYLFSMISWLSFKYSFFRKFPLGRVNRGRRGGRNR